MSVDPAPPDADLLEAFLASRDVVCPRCGYNLRAATSGACPECGQTLALSLRSPDRLHRQWPLLMLVFCWLFAAGTMNGYQSIRTVYIRATRAPQILFSNMLAPTAPIRPVPLPGGEGRDWSVVAPMLPPIEVDLAVEPAGDDDLAAASPSDQAALELDARQREIIGTIETLEAEAGMGLPPEISNSVASALESARQTLSSRQIQIMMSPGPSAGPAWSNVAWWQWAAAGGWSVLALVAAAGLIVLLVYRRRPVHARVALGLLCTGWVAFGGYFLYHVVRFAGEVV